MFEATQKSIAEQANKVCDKITEEAVIFENSGKICKIECSDCGRQVKLSSSINKETGKNSFSVFNFSRHYSSAHSNRGTEATGSSDDGESSKQTQIEHIQRELKNVKSDNDNKKNELVDLNTQLMASKQSDQTKQTEIERLQAELQKVKGDNEAKAKEIVDLNNKLSQQSHIIARKDEVIAEAHELATKLKADLAVSKAELTGFRSRLVELKANQSVNSKSTKVQQAKFQINLCCFEDIKAPGITINANEVAFKDCTGRDVSLHFNHIYHGSAIDDKLNGIRSALDAFIAGGTASVINYGTTGSGKTTTMFGLDGNYGLLGQAGDYILKSQQFKMSAYEILDDGCYDLMSNRKLDEKQSPLTEKLIKTIDEFKELVKKINDSRTQKSTSQNIKSSRSHLFVILTIENETSKMAFVDLAGFESLENEESKHINTSLSELNLLLINATKNQPFSPNKSNKMAINLKPFLMPPSQTIFLCHMNNDAAKKGLGYFKEFVSSTRDSKRPSRAPLAEISNSKLAR
ncbi:uncharacterized protein LOC129572513 [Sitodiplosis mosellana]|uniref:uncharacterized protein LOC129572513 n=1 Tax=Sitodiplosis mosellana TaxID=263140 RepID=UPI002443B506|nr:uncharacterized protein LOC129572513 [Sitodiplosis mosellana]